MYTSFAEYLEEIKKKFFQIAQDFQQEISDPECYLFICLPQVFTNLWALQIEQHGFNCNPLKKFFQNINGFVRKKLGREDETKIKKVSEKFIPVLTPKIIPKYQIGTSQTQEEIKVESKINQSQQTLSKVKSKSKGRILEVKWNKTIIKDLKKFQLQKVFHLLQGLNQFNLEQLKDLQKISSQQFLKTLVTIIKQIDVKKQQLKNSSALTKRIQWNLDKLMNRCSINGYTYKQSSHLMFEQLLSLKSPNIPSNLLINYIYYLFIKNGPLNAAEQLNIEKTNDEIRQMMDNCDPSCQGKISLQAFIAFNQQQYFD